VKRGPNQSKCTDGAEECLEDADVVFIDTEYREAASHTPCGIVETKVVRFCGVKGKAVPLQAWSGPEGSRKLRFPNFMTTAQDGGKVVSLTHRPLLPPGNAPGAHFCSRLSRPQGHSEFGRILSMKNSNDTSWNRTSDLPICSTAP